MSLTIVGVEDELVGVVSVVGWFSFVASAATELLEAAATAV